jgi:cell division protein FtsW
MIQLFTKYLKGNPAIWIIIIVLMLISLLEVFSATSLIAYKHNAGYYFFIKHAILLFISFGIIFGLHHVEYRLFGRLAFLSMILSVFLLILTLLVGTNLNQASRWLVIPGLGLTFQTSDFAKIALVVYLAKTIKDKQDVIKDFKKGFLPLIIPVFIITGLIFPANFSTAAMLFFVSMVILFVGRVRVLHLVTSVLIVAVFGLTFIYTAPYFMKHSRVATWKSRIETFVGGSDEKETVDDNKNFQSVQAKIAIAANGIGGIGLGKSVQKYILPHPYSDFIFAIIVEEFGFVAVVLIVFLYVYLFYHALLIMKKSEYVFEAILGFGLIFLIVIQAFINMGVAAGIFPVTGQPLPFISMGGTSLLFTGVAFGIILSVSRSVEGHKKEILETEEA